MITRRCTFRLYPSIAQAQVLSYWRRLHKDLYNAALYNKKTQYQRFGKSITFYDQQNSLPDFKKVWTEYMPLGSQALQATLKRVDVAFERFFKGLGGYPKFKSIRHYSGWTYPAKSGWKASTNGKNGYLEISNLGKVQMRGQARTWGTPTTCTIVYRRGKWYASITVQCEPARETGTGAIGLDFGCLTAVAMSDGAKIENPRFLGKTLVKIKATSSSKKRRTAPNRNIGIKASKRWRKTQKQVSKLQEKVSNQRQDWAHKTAAEIVSSNSLVATEKLNLKGMTRKPQKGKRKRQKTGLNRSILDVGMGMLRSCIEYKVIEAGGFLIEVPTQKVKPSQTCPECGHQEKKSLDQRVHQCSNCGYTEDRDVASAIVMLNWAMGLGTNLDKRGSQASTLDPKVIKHCGGFRQAWELKRQKLPVPYGSGSSS